MEKHRLAKFGFVSDVTLSSVLGGHPLGLPDGRIKRLNQGLAGHVEGFGVARPKTHWFRCLLYFQDAGTIPSSHPDQICPLLELNFLKPTPILIGSCRSYLPSFCDAKTKRKVPEEVGFLAPKCGKGFSDSGPGRKPWAS